ncbi:single-stranded DNA-binding protein (plasmid) [Lactobacillus sp. PV037]|uniref:single-stranded DNA-binding protein n=1 Tax=Lactobacillus sp. PV037 TaxID=2594496 RepID=UPI00223F4615|nr:single-stranded DNA-binding protein [Lactobacillus sp. PV037]QNQ82991.1 single-stranded DNA-binding protein [Lactobacillus sp. PV037]
MNSCDFIGRLTDDITVTTTQDGKSVAQFTLAVPRNKDTTDFIRCNAWNKNAEHLAQYSKKGDRIGISSHVHTGSYKKKGTTVYYTKFIVSSITLIESHKKEANTTSTNSNSQMVSPSDPFSSDSTSSPANVTKEKTQSETETSNPDIEELVKDLPI